MQEPLFAYLNSLGQRIVPLKIFRETFLILYYLRASLFPSSLLVESLLFSNECLPVEVFLP